MVRGLPTARTSEPFVTQCADTTHTAFGRGRRWVSPASVLVNLFCSMAFIGDPCPTKRTGIFMSDSLPIRFPPRHGVELHRRGVGESRSQSLGNRQRAQFLAGLGL